jgi:hypothetical protein
MPDPGQPKLDDDKLLLADYAHFAESFLKNEEIGEHRVDFFITITTAIAGGVAALFFASDNIKITESARQ